MRLEENLLFNNRYRLSSLLGSGGFSQVWLAEDTASSDMKIALKIFAAGTGLDSDGLKLFANEYAIVFNLNHPNLLRPMHYDKWEMMPYLVMQYMSEGNCQDKCGNMTEFELAGFMVQMGNAIAYLHDQDPPILHQDIKPANILVDAKGKYYLTDFGISTKIRKTLTKSLGKQVDSGTTAYMAPERFSKKLEEREPNKSNDIFSLGVTFFELLTDELPYGEQGGVYAQSGVEAAELPEKFSEELRILIGACLEKEPWKRPTALELAASGKAFADYGQWGLPEKLRKSQPTIESGISEVPKKVDTERKTSPRIDFDAIPDPAPQVVTSGTPTVASMKDEPVRTKKKSKLVFIVPIVLVVVAAVVLVILQPWRNRDKEAWENALTENSLASFKQYIVDFPQGEFVAIAGDSIQSKEEMEEVNNAIKAHDMQTYIDFIEKYPENKNTPVFKDSVKAMNRRDSLQNAPDYDAYAKAEKTNTIASYEKYMKDFPGGKNEEKAKSKIEDLKANAKKFADEGDKFAKNNDYESAVKSYDKSLQIFQDPAVKSKRDDAQKKMPFSHYDNFSREGTTWYNTQDEDMLWKHDNGYLKCYSYNTQYTYTKHKDFDRAQGGKTFTFSVDVKMVKGPANSNFGMIFAGNANNTNRFAIDAEKDYYVGQRKSGSNSGKWGSSSAVKTVTSWNTLKVSYDGTNIIYYVNGTKVEQKKAEIFGNYFGIFYSGDVDEVWFDNFSLKVTF